MSAAPTVRSAIAEAVAILKNAGIEQSARDARLLMAAALGVEPARVTMLISESLADPAPFRALIARRANHEPVSKILGRRAFYGREFLVTPDVLDPRPDTEALVTLALEEPFSRVLDLGTGSGCILLTLLAEAPAATGTGSDVSQAALSVAARNAAALGVVSRARLVAGNWFKALGGGETFDLIVSNPPYIAQDEMAGLEREVREHDPEGALTDYGDGLGAYREIVAEAPSHLAPGGRLLLEIGWRQGAAVSTLLQSAGFVDIGVHTDLEGRDRVVSARRQS